MLLYGIDMFLKCVSEFTKTENFKYARKICY